MMCKALDLDNAVNAVSAGIAVSVRHRPVVISFRR